MLLSSPGLDRFPPPLHFWEFWEFWENRCYTKFTRFGPVSGTSPYGCDVTANNNLNLNSSVRQACCLNIASLVPRLSPRRAWKRGYNIAVTSAGNALHVISENSDLHAVSACIAVIKHRDGGGCRDDRLLGYSICYCAKTSWLFNHSSS